MTLRRGQSVTWAAVRLTILTAAMVAGCEVRTDRWLERQAAVDPPELWRVEVVNSDSLPVQLCADTLLREGFKSPLPEVGGQPCILIGEPVETDGGRIGRCASGGHALMFSVKTEGDPSDFTVALNVQTLGRHGYIVTQTRRYTRLGPCPQGWSIGDNTDQQGRKRNNIWPPAWGG
ncbi:hypothetical protein [Brevundimonas sp.]|uniref:hypothetical protein n=1 Tax=Brevundimonas sp. TaxID=1871086 RepID=UPI00286CBD34|nr:hypothetical protein [Brevundimonas sp.]